MKVSVIKLPNKLTLLLYRLKNCKSAGIDLYIKTGYFYAGKKLLCLPHLTEHAVMSGNKKLPTSIDLVIYEEELGISSRHVTSGEVINFSYYCPLENLTVTLKLIRDIIFYPLLTRESVTREKSIIRQEYSQKRTTPYWKYLYTIYENLFGADCPYTLIHNYQVLENSIRRIERKDIIKFHRRYFQPANVILGIVSDLQEQDIISKVNSVFRANKNSSQSSFYSIEPIEFTRKQFLLDEKIKHATVSFAFPLAGYAKTSPKQIAINYMLFLLLVGLKSSRLITTLREKKGLVYSTPSDFKYFKDYGSIIISASCAVENINAVIELIKKEIEQVKKKGTSRGRLTRLKKILNYKNILRVESSVSLAKWIVKEYYHTNTNNVFLPEDYQRLYDKITNKNIQRTANKNLDPKNMTLGIMGPSNLLYR